MNNNTIDVLLKICDKTKPISTVVGSAPNHGTDFLRKAINDIKENNKNASLIGVDGGAELLLQLGFEPDIFVGDCDSFADTEGADFFGSIDVNKVFIYPSEKDDTDMQLAVDTAVHSGTNQVVMLNATNGRLDHFLGCFQLMEYFGELAVNPVRVFIVDEQNVMFYVGQDMCEVEFELDEGFYFSIIPVTDCVEELSIVGAKYQLDGFNLHRGPSRSISNCLPDGCRCGGVKLSKKTGAFVVVISQDV